MKIVLIKALKASCILLSTGILVSSCENTSTSYKESNLQFADSVTSVITDATGTVIADSSRVFIRKADVQFKVNDVHQSTLRIEDIVRKHRGFVTLTNLQSHIESKQNIRQSADSMKEVITYRVENDITIRVPNTELDSALKEIYTLVEFLDHRKMSAEDVKLQLLASTLSENRFQTHKQRLEKAITQQGKKLRQTTEAENELVTKQQTADQTKIYTMDLLDEVNYSTITLNLYQPETQKTTMYAYVAPITPYEPNYGSKLLDSLSTGGKFLAELILFLLKLWPLCFLATIVYLFIRWQSKQSS